MGGSLLSKAEVPGSSLLGHLPKEFSLRLTWCPWLVGYYGTRGISRGARKLARTPSLSKKKKKKNYTKTLRAMIKSRFLFSKDIPRDSTKPINQNAAFWVGLT